ncbi:putative flap endonuclease-1-like 5' DNA nuclease [Caulobacter ginsengisoli]|uniref:Flap endonuclease-1-like 5' DNA nuclease n=1 Tax=Caulobacter ginsengisoli TaxID=400775 RepID=A0ABU0IKM9_9CAUL|nr:helix-hairpin-helix domain-containing protein [Caulobacter ginsengisoli]MDQ0462563.1 putative flap endonuclease-1-like 5' DNA nuclease [Caulobacter ginsengisoli]
MDKITLPTADDAAKALRLPLGAASPLWFAFAGAAAVGAAYWWSTRWMRPVNIEALTALQETVVEAAVETVEATVEAVEVVADAVVEAAPEPVAEAVAAVIPEPVAPVTPDDLTRLVGVGPKLAASLAERGVTTFAQIAAWTADDLAAVDKDLKLLGRAERDAWVAQAKRFLEA